MSETAVSWTKRFFRFVFAALVATVVAGSVSALVFKNFRIGPGGVFSMNAGIIECLVCSAASFCVPSSDGRPVFRMIAGGVSGAGYAAALLLVPGAPEALRSGFSSWVLPSVWTVQGVCVGLATGLIADAFRKKENATWALACILGVIPSSMIFCAALALFGNKEGIRLSSDVFTAGLFGSLFAAPVCILFGTLFMTLPIATRFSSGIRNALIKGALVGAVSGTFYLLMLSFFKADIWSTFLLTSMMSWPSRFAVWVPTGMLYATTASLIRHVVFAPNKNSP